MYKSFQLVICLLTLLLSSLQAQDPQQGWDFQYPGDNFDPGAELDLRFLNEGIAGENGFIRLSEDGAHFVNEAGRLRFWAINGGTLVRGHDPDLTDGDLAVYARFLAKMGVNVIRYHGEMFSTTGNIQDPNKVEANNIWRVVAAMKKEGIYTVISPFWPAHLQDIPGSWNLGDYVGDIDPWGLIYFDQHFRDAYKSWVTYLYTAVNPHTGLALKDDPAVALIQIINEDGVFFWTINGVQPSLKRIMEEQFFSWTESKYGNITEAYQEWEQTAMENDNTDLGTLEIINIWYATDDPNVPTPTSGFKKRLRDQMHFFAETQRSTYQEIYEHYRSIGCQQLINAGNWRTADAGRLLDLERWTNLPGEVMAANRYYDPGHFGPNNGWRIERLHHYQGKSAMFNPHLLPINSKQPEGRPFLITESGWNLPHKYQAEGPFLISAYQSLTGMDGYFWFSPSATTYEDDLYWPYFGLINGEEPMFRWTVSTPGQIGMFPANALAYRLGYIQQGETVVREARSFEDLIERNLPLISEEKSFDPNRDEYNPNTMSGETLLSPLTYLAGPVITQYEADPDSNYIAPQLDELVNIADKQLTSITNELSWDYEQGLCIMDTPKAQGICGFPEEKEYHLKDLSISSSNDYVVVNVVSMDQKDLALSDKVLVQVGTVYQPTGWKETATSFTPNGAAPPIDGYRIESLGQMPLKAADTEVTLKLKNIPAKYAWQLDAAGYRTKQLELQSDGDETILTLPKDAMYVILKTDQNSTGLQELEPANGIKVFPNPNRGTFKLELTEGYRGLDIEKVEVFSATGSRLAAYDFQAEREYDLSAPAGIYFVHLHAKSKGVLTRKMVVE